MNTLYMDYMQAVQSNVALTRHGEHPTSFNCLAAIAIWGSLSQVEVVCIVGPRKGGNPVRPAD